MIDLNFTEQDNKINVNDRSSTLRIKYFELQKIVSLGKLGPEVDYQTSINNNS